jgi:signal transduction histidine kinase
MGAPLQPPSHPAVAAPGNPDTAVDDLDPGDAVPRRRSRRDVVVDVLAVVVALVVGALSVEVEWSRPEPLPDGLLLLDAVVGGAGCFAVWFRRRWPVMLAVGLCVLAAFSAMVGGAALVLLFTVAVHRRWPAVAALAVLTVSSSAVYYLLRPDPTLPLPAMLVTGATLTVAIVAWGQLLRARRQLVVSRRDRAERAEAEQRLRVEQAQQAERARMAREMHDVLGHRLSLLSMHAGALEFRPDAGPEAVAHAAGVIRQSAHLALEDLREVIGVLREGSDGPGARPQPTLAELTALVEESRAAGVTVNADVRVADLAAVPASTGRSAYRIVQEGLTNARRHAPGSPVDLVVAAGADGGLVVELRNDVPSVADDATAAADPAGGGLGLVGLSERAALAGGRLEYGPTSQGGFRVHAWLPWSR